MPSRTGSIKDLISGASFGASGSSSHGPSDPTFAVQYAHDFIMANCEPCKQHQTPLRIIKATILTGGVQVSVRVCAQYDAIYMLILSVVQAAEIHDAWMCPTSTRKSVLPVEWNCVACRAYYIHRAIVLPHIGFLGEHMDDMTHSSAAASWDFTCPPSVPVWNVIKSMSMMLHCLLPDLVEVSDSTRFTSTCDARDLLTSIPSHFVTFVSGQVHSNSSQTFWVLQSGLSGKNFPIMISLVVVDASNKDRPLMSLSACVGTTGMDYMAQQRKDIDDLVLSNIDKIHREAMRAASISTPAGIHSRRARQAMVMSNHAGVSEVFQGRSPFGGLSSGSSSGSSPLPGFPARFLRQESSLPRLGGTEAEQKGRISLASIMMMKRASSESSIFQQKILGAQHSASFMTRGQGGSRSLSPSTTPHQHRKILRDNLVNPRLSVSMPGTPMASLSTEGRRSSGNSSPSISLASASSVSASSVSVSSPSIPETNSIGQRPLPPLLVDCVPSDSSRSCADTALVSSLGSAIGSTGYQQRAFDFVDKEEDEDDKGEDGSVDIIR